MVDETRISAITRIGPHYPIHPGDLNSHSNLSTWVGEFAEVYGRDFIRLYQNEKRLFHLPFSEAEHTAVLPAYFRGRYIYRVSQTELYPTHAFVAALWARYPAMNGDFTQREQRTRGAALARVTTTVGANSCPQGGCACTG